MKTVTLIFNRYTTVRETETGVATVPDDYCAKLFERGYHVTERTEEGDAVKVVLVKR